MGFTEVVWFLVPWHASKHFEAVFEPSSSKRYLVCRDLVNWSINGDAIPRIEIENLKSYKQFNWILNELKNATPILARHYDFMPFQELTLRKIALETLKLALLMKDENPEFVYFGYQSSHHLDSLSLELAARINEIPQIFQYPVTDKTAVLFHQTQGVDTRRFVPTTKALEDVYSLISPKYDAKYRAPASIRETHSHSFFYSLIWLVSKSIRFHSVRILQKVFGIFKSKQENVYLKRPNLRRNIEILYNHKKAIQSLRSFQEQDKIIVESILTRFDERPILLCASYQPEATTFPEGGEKHNLLDLVLYIRSIGITRNIVYKEHPMTFVYKFEKWMATVGIERSVTFYSMLREFGCYFASDDINLLDNESIVCVTINGTIGLERSMRGLTTYVASKPWYGYLPGIKPIEALNFADRTSEEADQDLGTKAFNELLKGRLFPTPKYTDDSSSKFDSLFAKYFPIVISSLLSNLEEK